MGTWYWLSVGIVLCIAEMLIGSNFFLLWSGLAAMIQSVILIFVPDLAWEYQLLLFSGLSMTLVWISFKYGLRRQSVSEKTALNERAQRWIGHRFVLETDVYAHQNSKVWLSGVPWQVTANQDYSAGQLVQVVCAQESVLWIEPVDQAR